VQLEPITLTPDDAADGESWEEVVLVDTSLPGIDARALGFMEVRFDSTDLSGAKLPNLFLSECELDRCDLSNAVAHAGSMRRVKCSGGRLTGLRWTSGEIRDTTFADCRIDLASFERTGLSSVVFEDCILRDADFRAARMESVAFRRCDLTGADISGARLRECSMAGCQIDGLSGVDRLRGVAMPWPDILAAAAVFAGEIGVRVLDDDAE
jgi:uncharacterized protein YjbI with pentapeptide repeats